MSGFGGLEWGPVQRMGGRVVDDLNDDADERPSARQRRVIARVERRRGLAELLGAHDQRLDVPGLGRLVIAGRARMVLWAPGKRVVVCRSAGHVPPDYAERAAALGVRVVEVAPGADLMTTLQQL